MEDHILSWNAPEYEHREHTADWYWAVGIISISLAVAFVIVGNMLLSIIIILGVGSLLAYAKHPPKIIECGISKKGINVDKTLYPWRTLESFWVLEGNEDAKYPHSPKIILTSKKRLMPHIIIPINAHIADEAHRVLSHMLHEEYLVEPLPERLMRRLGF